MVIIESLSKFKAIAAKECDGDKSVVLKQNHETAFAIFRFVLVL